MLIAVFITEMVILHKYVFIIIIIIIIIIIPGSIFVQKWVNFPLISFFFFLEGGGGGGG